MKRNKIIIAVALLIIVVAMAIGYSAFATELTINGTAEITGEWNIKITGVEIQNANGEVDAGKPEFTDTTFSFSTKLKKPGDTVTYAVTIENLGTIDATLSNLIFKEGEDECPEISYKTSEVATTLSAGDQTTLSVTVRYNPSATEVPLIKTKTISGIIEYTQN